MSIPIDDVEGRGYVCEWLSSDDICGAKAIKRLKEIDKTLRDFFNQQNPSKDFSSPLDRPRFLCEHHWSKIVEHFDYELNYDPFFGI